MKQIILSFFFAFSVLWSSAQLPVVVKAVASTVTEPTSKDQEGWKSNEWNGLFFYQGTGSPTKLCVTDGTNAGTQFLADIGSGGLVATIPAQDFMYIITNRLVSFPPFIYEAEIWKSDGTAVGTSLVKTMPQIASSSVSNIWTSDRDAKRNFSVMGNTLLFGGYDATNGVELWKSDGTTAGTVLIKDINTAGGGSSSPAAFCKLGTEIFFTAIESSGRKLWKTDGTAVGTVQIPVTEPFFILDNAVGIVNNKMIFYAHNTVDGYEPYVSDGTASGTFMLKNINAAGNSWITQSQNAHLRFNSKYCFFVANNGTANALWRTDGTTTGTIQLTTNAQAAFSGVSGGSYTDVDETGLWMIEYNSSGSGNNEKIYRSDGTVAGTHQTAAALSYAQYVKIYKGALWMASRNTGSPANTEPWRSGGNAATTNKAFEIAAGAISANPFGFFVKNNKLYFFASSTAAPDRNLYQYTSDFTFNGSLAGGNWKDSANWNGMMPPGITDIVNVDAGTPNAVNINTANAYAGILNLGNNAAINLTATTDSLIVNTQLNFAGSNSFTGNGVLALRSVNANDTVKINGAVTTNKIAVQSNASLLSGNISVANNINLTTGNLLLNNNNLILTGNTSTATTTGTVYITTNGTGSLQIQNIGTGARTGTVNFPIGTTTEYSPVSIINAGTSDDFSARVINKIFSSYTGETPGAQQYATGAVNNTWFINEENTGGSDATINLQWNVGQELSLFDRTQSYFGHYTGGTWSLGTQGVATGANPYYFGRSNITSFSPFGILNNTATLPLTFISFAAQKCNNSQVCLTWKTENELNVSHFEIERSTDGRTFTTVKNESAKNALSNNYNITDDIIALQNHAKLFYRLRQVDTDGRFTYSSIAVISLSKIQTLSVYPNPASDKIYLTGYENIKLVQLFNVDGEKIKEITVLPDIDISNLANGLYFIKVWLKSGTCTELKFIKR